MSGFKNFLMRGNLVEFAVAVIMATAFGAVVTAFVAWLTSLLPEETYDNLFTDGKLGDLLNAGVSFLVIAAVVYFFVVLPYTKAKERYFPDDEEEKAAELTVLEEIRDSLAGRP